MKLKYTVVDKKRSQPERLHCMIPATQSYIKGKNMQTVKRISSHQAFELEKGRDE
jgi:hypothetical protein